MHDVCEFRTLEAAILVFSSLVVVVQGTELRGISTNVVMPPAAAAWVAVTNPALHARMQ